MARPVRPFDDRWNPDEHVAQRVAASLTLVQQLLVGSTEQLRLALIVLDGVTELLLRRNVRGHAMFFNLGDRIQELNSQAHNSDDEKLPVFVMTFPLRPDDELPTERGAVYLSTRARGDLHRAFDPNVDIAVFYRNVTRAKGQALKDAHYYRNGAYHRDELDDVALEGIVAAQREAVSELLSEMSLIISPLGADEEDRRLAAPLGIKGPLTLRSMSQTLGQGDPAAAARGFADSVAGRLRWITQMLQEISAFLSLLPGIVTFADALRLCQLDQPWPDLAVSRSRTVPVTETTLNEWTAGGETIRGIQDLPEALHQFRMIDEPLSELTYQVDMVAGQMDREIDAEVDRRRGR